MPANALRNLPAPAKLNLFLHVVGRRSDGYHLLESVFQLIDHGDRLDLRLRNDGKIRLLNSIAGVADEQNLCVRAARLLAKFSNCPLGVDINLSKYLPIGGGLGGGSSDAATTLLGLNRLWQLNKSRSQLARIGLTLGADVPFFLFGQTALASGIGEQLRAVALPARYYVVVEPGIAVPTAVVFASTELTRNTKRLKIEGFSGVGSMPLDACESALAKALKRAVNDLQAVVLARFPAVADALDLLRQAATSAGVDAGRARMTGSGSSLFLPLIDSAQAERVADEVRKGFIGSRLQGKAWVAHSLSRHPLAMLAPKQQRVNRAG